MNLLAGVGDQRLRNLLVMTLLFILWMMCRKPFHKRMHLQMQNIGRMLSVVRWTLSCQMGFGRSLIVQMGAN
jgi:hypothetical protein